MRTLLAILTTVLFFSAIAQNTEEELAAQFYGSGDYEKAAALYKKIHKAQPNSVYIYDNYLNTLLALNDEKQAVSVVKKQIKKDKSSMKYKVDLGFVYMHFNKDDKADKHFDQLIETYVTDPYVVSQLAQAFLRREYVGRAIETFEDAITVHGKKYYWMNLLNLYRSTGVHVKAVNLGLDVLKDDPKQIGNVNYQFSRLAENDEAAAFLQQQLLTYSQNYPDKEVYSDLLMNFFLQQKKYRSAFRQAKAIDKRKNEKGQRVLNLAKLCVQNKAFDVAEQCYQYLVDKGPRSLYYIDGRVGLLNSSYLKVTSTYQSDQAEVEPLIQRYESFLSDFGYSSGTASSMRRLAELYLFHNNETKKAISLLNELLQVPRLSVHFVGESKLLLGDAYLMDEAIWDARLLYGQVDKDFKEDPLGREAKFRNARLSYFTGDFEWANDQLDILKMATTQLIANNALELALLIQDNTGLDSTEAAMEAYAEADFLFYQNKLDECLLVLNLLPFQFPNHSLSDEILFLKAKVSEKQGEYDQALEFYKQVYTGHQFDILADNALFRAAEIHYRVKGDSETAKLLYETLILEHTSSLYTVEARKKFEEIKNNQIQ